MEDTDQVVLATVEDFHSGSVFLQRLHAPPHIKNLTVEVENAKFEKLAVAVGNVLNPGEDLVLLEDVSDATILHTLRLRLGQGKIFTSIGPVLVVVNHSRDSLPTLTVGDGEHLGIFLQLHRSKLLT